MSVHDKWWYKNNPDNSARYILGQRGSRPLVVVGVNPSTAIPDKLDPTLKSVKRFSEWLGYDGWLMINLYPQRATNPDKMHLVKDNAICQQNLCYLSASFRKLDAFTIWAAWGTLIEKRKYLIDCLRDIVLLTGCNQTRWITIGKRSIAGHPHHPLYLRSDSTAEPFNVHKYLAELKLKRSKNERKKN